MTIRVLSRLFYVACGLSAGLVGAASPQLPVIKHLGVEFGRYDAASGQAGDFLFTNKKYEFDVKKMLSEFGDVVVNELTGPAGKTSSSVNYGLPPGVAVKSMIDGVVKRVLKNTGATSDSEIHVSPNDSYGPWLIIVDHVSNVAVVEGQKVQAGDKLGEVGSNRIEYSVTRIVVPLRAGSANVDFCPWQFLDLKLKDSLLQKLKDMQADWETYKGDPNVYDEASMPLPACRSLEIGSDNAQSERVFDWAEAVYPQLFKPAGPPAQSVNGYFYRYYPASGAYLGQKDGRILYYDGKAGSSVLDVGAISKFTPQAFALGF